MRRNALQFIGVVISIGWSFRGNPGVVFGVGGNVESDGFATRAWFSAWAVTWNRTVLQRGRGFQCRR
jgi:hypothetical protein